MSVCLSVCLFVCLCVYQRLYFALSSLWDVTSCFDTRSYCSSQSRARFRVFIVTGAAANVPAEEQQQQQRQGAMN